MIHILINFQLFPTIVACSSYLDIAFGSFHIYFVTLNVYVFWMGWYGGNKNEGQGLKSCDIIEFLRRVWH